MSRWQSVPVVPTILEVSLLHFPVHLRSHVGHALNQDGIFLQGGRPPAQRKRMSPNASDLFLSYTRSSFLGSWLYQLILGMDANFRLRSKVRGVGTTDVLLNPGMAFFVKPEPYAAFIKTAIDEDEVLSDLYSSTPAC